MKASEIQTGETYLAKVSGNVVPVKVLAAVEKVDPRGRARQQWRCRNEMTGREITVRSAQRFRALAAAASHRDRYPEQYEHPLCGRRVRTEAGEEFTVERVVSSRFGLIAMPASGTSGWAVADLTEAE